MADPLRELEVQVLPLCFLGLHGDLPQNGHQAVLTRPCGHVVLYHVNRTHGTTGEAARGW